MEVGGQLPALVALPLQIEAQLPIWIRGWVGPRASVDMVVKRRIPAPASNQTPVIQPTKLPGSWLLDQIDGKAGWLN
jgi:hypothetical protein